MHSSGMQTVRSSGRLSRGGGLPQCMLGIPPGADTPQEQTPPPGPDPLWTDTRLLKHNLRNFVADGNKR